MIAASSPREDAACYRSDALFVESLGRRHNQIGSPVTVTYIPTGYASNRIHIKLRAKAEVRPLKQYYQRRTLSAQNNRHKVAKSGKKVSTYSM